MLPDPTVPASLLAVLELVRGNFTTPTFRMFAALVTGLIAQTGRCTVTGMLTGAGSTRAWSHDRTHAFFSRAAWNPDILGISLSHLIVRRLLPEDAVLTVAVDDALFKRRGKKVFGAAWQHDGAAQGPKPVGRGTCFVVIGLVVELPFLARPVCMPLTARLWRPGQELSKVDLAASMLCLLAACHWGRLIHVVADAAYHGKALRDLPATCTFTTRLPASAVLYDLAPPRTGKRGRPALKGERLGTAAQLAATAVFTTVQVTRYQRTENVHLPELTCLWYGSFHTRTVRVILLRDQDTGTGYDLALVTTDLTTCSTSET
ncbi:IS701 family transposase [Streptomyces sp. NPDC054933]